MSLHPGEKGFCAKHGEYDEFCSKCSDEKRTLVGRERSSTLRCSTADKREPAPTGDGYIVLDYIHEKLDIQIVSSSIPQALPPLTDPNHLRLLLADLIQRSETGAKKHGTPLRVNNGRKAYFDLYQEICDAIMYAGQARLEGDKEGGQYVELLIQIGSQLAGIVNKRG